MKRDVILKILSFSKPYRRFFIGAILCALVSVTATLLMPVLIGRAVDCLTGPGQVDFTGIFHISLQFAALLAVHAVFGWLLSLFTNIIAYSTAKDIRKALFRKLNAVPLRYIDQNAHGDLVSRVVNDVDLIADGLLQTLTQLFTGVVTILGTLCFMLSINWVIALAVVLVTPLSFLIASFVAKSTNTMFQKQSATQGKLGGYINEMIGNQKTVKLFGSEQQAEAAFEEINQTLYGYGVKAQFFSSLTNPSTRLINNITYALVGVGGAIGAINGLLSVGQIATFLTYANQYAKPFNEITGVLTQLQTAIASAGRAFEVLETQNETPDAPEALVLSGTEGRVSMGEVSFSYTPSRPLIENLNLMVAPGSSIAIVGPTGSGKTTIINLLMRFYDVDAGHICIDGHDIRQITRDSLRKNYGMVLQETWVFSGTIRDNICYGKPDATDEQVVKAAKAAFAHSFIERLPDGYDTVISEDGGNLSAGQKQLLCIARVMLVDPPMLILDEATSSIDTRTELKIQRAFSAMMQGRTSFVVAHRLSTIREADTILVMDKGKIVEQGPHDALLARGGFYANLYQSQFAATEEA